MDDQDDGYDPEIDGSETRAGCLIFIICLLAAANVLMMFYKWS